MANWIARIGTALAVFTSLLMLLPAQEVAVEVLGIGPPTLLRASIPQAHLEKELQRIVPATIDLPGKVFGNILIWRNSEVLGLTAAPLRDSLKVVIAANGTVSVSGSFSISGRIRYQYEHVKVVWKKWGPIKRPVVERDWRWTNGTVSASVDLNVPFIIESKPGDVVAPNAVVGIVLRADSERAKVSVRDLVPAGINKAFGNLIKLVGDQLASNQVRAAIIAGAQKLSVDVTDRLKEHRGSAGLDIIASGSKPGMLWFDMRIK